MKIEWKEDKGKQGRKVIDIKIAVGDDVPKGRFILYPVNEKINMWCLYDVEKKVQWYIMKEAAEERIEKALKGK